MIGYQFIVRCGGCVSLMRKEAATLLVIDSDRLPFNNIQVVGLLINGTPYPIEIIFANKTALVTYLNDVFKVINGLQGTFSAIIGGGITYYNIEEYSSIEIMAIYLSEMRCYQVGTPDEIYSQSTPIPVIGPVTVDALKATIGDAQVLAVFIGSQFLEPVASQELLEYDNVNIYVLVQQIPA